MFLLDIDTQTVYQIQHVFINYWDWIITLVTVFFMVFFGVRKKLIHINKFPEYKYYTIGLYAKIASAVMFVIVYYYYYKGGDTLSYYESSIALANLFYKNPEGYFYVITHNYNEVAASYFDYFTGYPYSYLASDSKTYLVIQLISPITIITFKSFLLSTVVLAYFTYRGSWKLFQVYYYYFPEIGKKLSWCILLVPSVLFWGSGILKDSLTLMSTCYFTYLFHHLFILRKEYFPKLFYLLLHALIILGIKPYIFLILFPTLLFWMAYLRYKKIKNEAIRILMFPALIVGIIAFSLLFFKSIGDSMDKFSVDNALQTASITQNDLKQDYYEGESFDIGNYDGSMLGAVKMFPNATFAGLFRPFINEARSIFMLMSALENLILLYFLIMIFFRAPLKKIGNLLLHDPILLFSFTYSFLFAFMLGLTTSNFGALVRFKIPMLPFFTAAIIITNHVLKEIKRMKYEKIT